MKEERGWSYCWGSVDGEKEMAMREFERSP